jgi:hypothetical protein
MLLTILIPTVQALSTYNTCILQYGLNASNMKEKEKHHARVQT